MSPRVALVRTISEQATRPRAASTRSGSNGSGPRGGSGGSSRRRWIGLWAGAVAMWVLERMRGAGYELLLDAEVLGEDQPGGGRGGLGAEPSLLDRDRHQDGSPSVGRGRVADVPGLVGLVGALRGARLSVDRNREAREHIGGGAAGRAGGQMQPVHDGLAIEGIDLDVPRRRRVDALEQPAGGVLDGQAQVRR